MVKTSQYITLILFTCTLLLGGPLAFAQQNSGNPNFPFPQNKDFQYGFNPSTLSSADATAAYEDWKSSFAENCGNDTWRIKFDNTSETVSEGIGYGMLIAVYHADKTLFDGLWQYYKNARNENGVMNWKRGGCANSAIGNNGATDAELDAAMALIIASCQWPNSATHDYASDATTLIGIIKNHEIESGSYVVKPGDKFGGSSLTNPSYFAPAYFRAYADFTGTDQTFWNNVADKCYQILANNSHASTGLVSDWCNGSGTPGGGGYAFGGTRYHYDAARTPWRFATDYLWYGNPEAQAYLQKNVDWINGSGGGIANIGDSYERDGTKMSNNHNSTFVGAFANAAMAASQADADAFASDFKNIPANNDRAYFQRTLRALYYLQLSGNFWYPCSDVPISSVEVTITNPSSTSTFAEGENITIEASATTGSGSITRMEFYTGNTKLGEDNSAPYSFTWNDIPSGKQTIKVVAFNSEGETGEALMTLNVIKSVVKTNTTPNIDGTIDNLWQSIAPATIENVTQGSGNRGGDSDLSASWKAMWTDTDIYVLVEVNDNTRVNDSPDLYNDDTVEIYFDSGNEKAGSFDSNDFQYEFRFNDTQASENNGKSTAGITFGQTETGSGYIMEVKIPWSTILNNNPMVDQLIGFDVHVNDDDDGGGRDSKISWNATEDQAWQNPGLFGTIVLKGSNCTVPPAAGNISGNFTVCEAEESIYSIQSVSGAETYTWQVPAGATITSGQGTNSVTVLWGNAGGSISVVPGNVCGTGQLSSANVSVTPLSQASVSISGENQICSGYQVTFNSSIQNGGNSPSYQWKVNGSPIDGQNSNSFSTSNLSNGDRVTLEMTSNKNCIANATLTSNEIAVNVTNSAYSSVSITADQNSICSGDQITFSAIPENGGNNPTYQWRVNGSNVQGANGSTFTSATLSDGNRVSVILYSDQPCVIDPASYSNEITVNVNSTTTAAVNIIADDSDICEGQTVTFTATPQNGGNNPTYQWRKNGVNIFGEKGVQYSASNLANGDRIVVRMTSNKSCVTTSLVTSNRITMTVTPAETATAVVSANETSICSGQQVIFTALTTNQGNNPTYQWLKNGKNINGATNQNYSTTNLNNLDEISIHLNSSLPCVNNPVVFSEPVQVSVQNVVIPSVSITASQTDICPGQSVTFSATSNGGGQEPVYSWFLNGKILGGSGTTYIASNIVSGDEYQVKLYSSLQCASLSEVSSNPISIIVSNSVTPSVDIVTESDRVCEGTQVSLKANYTSGGSNPSFQWRKDGVVIQGASSESYLTEPLETSATYSVALSSNLECATSSVANASIVLTTDPTPTQANAGVDQYVSGSETLLSANAPAIGIGSWSLVSGSASFTQASNPQTLVSNLSEGENILQWSIYNGACTPSVSQVSVFVGSEPAANNITGPSQVESGDTVIYFVPLNPGSAYEWNVPDGFMILDGQGTNQILVSVTNDSGSGSVNVSESNDFGSSEASLKVDKVTSLYYGNNDFSYELYPNPFNNEIEVVWPTKENLKINITDLKGLRVLELEVKSASSIRIGEDLKPGVYFIQINSNQKTVVQKIIKI